MKIIIITEVWEGTPDFNQGVYDLDLFKREDPYDIKLYNAINNALQSIYGCDYFNSDEFDYSTGQLNNCRIKDFKYPSVIDGSIIIIYQ